MKPPSHIDGALILESAWSETPFGHVRFEDGSIAAAIHGLAIARYPNSDEIYRFSCNARWETQQDADYTSVDEAKALLPEQYRESPVTWSIAQGVAANKRRPTSR
jgi:hypothetical protein